MKNHQDKFEKPGCTGDKILLAMLPFNDPQIPPLGIANLKSYLKQHNYNVTTVDANVEMEFRDIFDRYFETVKQYIPPKKPGNFYSMRLDIMQFQMMAYLNYRRRLEIPRYQKIDALACKNPEEYRELVKMLVYKTFFHETADSLVNELDDITLEFFLLVEDYVLRLLEKEKPTVLGLSVCIAMLPASLLAFKLTKELYPHIQTVMGGGIYADDLALHSPNFKYFVEKTPYIDKLIVGEGEVLLLQFLKKELPAEQKVYSIKDVNNKPLDLSTVSIPDFNDFRLERYPYMSINASVGCVYNCAFCTIPTQWGKYRKKKAQQMVAELIRMSEIYGSQLFLFVDSLLNPLVTPLANALLESPATIYWDGSLKVCPEACNTDNTLLWRRGGFYRAHIGVETGSQRVLDLMDKRITVDEIKTAISSLAYAGIKTTTFWVVGYPGETEDDFRQTLALAEELKDDIYETTIRPYLHYLSPTDAATLKQLNLDQNPGNPLLYPEKFKDKLMVQTWIKNTEPGREEIFWRLNRFNKHIRELGIPNPYSWLEINEADKRWQELHENGVPPLVDFKNKDMNIHECKTVEKVFFLKNTLEDDGNFDFQE